MGWVINGAGTVAVAGATEISNLALEGSAVLSNGGTITQTGNWYLGYNASDTSQLVNKAGATFTIANNSNIYRAAGAALTNAGTLVRRGVAICKSAKRPPTPAPSRLPRER